MDTLDPMVQSLVPAGRAVRGRIGSSLGALTVIGGRYAPILGIRGGKWCQLSTVGTEQHGPRRWLTASWEGDRRQGHGRPFYPAGAEFRSKMRDAAMSGLMR
jgi:hypothetical protein